MQTYIFDLDHTVIDSTHRQLTKADGSLDLAHWIENCNKEKIMADTLLPLARTMRERIAQGQEVIICTARVMGEHDYQFLKDHGLFVPDILSRKMGNHKGDAQLKELALRMYARNTGRSWARFSRNACIYDDNLNVLSRLASIGIAAYNATSLNAILRAA